MEEENQTYIDVTELELNVATKNRSVSMDVHNKRRQQTNAENNNLPDIGGGSALPNVAKQNMPTIVLPHSEPLTEE